jgi:hypothetical protein
MATVRRQVRIARRARDVWAVIGDPVTIADWFPGITAAEVDGDTRVIHTETGLPLPEQIVTNDPLQRRFQYRLLAPMVRDHLGTIDVFDLGGDASLVSYATDCEPAPVALIIGGATGAALRELRRQLESAGASDQDAADTPDTPPAAPADTPDTPPAAPADTPDTPPAAPAAEGADA